MTTAMLRIVADENIPFAEEAFGLLGTVTRVPGRAIDSAILADADALMVRSITRVDEALLSGTPVRFVGTATIGMDHIDAAYLAAAGIGFSSAPGCNANSVAEYITAALLELRDRLDVDLSTLRLGIVGVGNVGSRVREKAEALGMTCVLNDPPRAAQTGDARYRPIAEILDCDVVSLHTPLERGGPHPTWHLVDANFLDGLKPGAVLFNTSRGAVADNAAVLAALRSGRLRAAVLDVWEGEPNPDVALLQETALASPHIAGYSFDGKVNGTRQIYTAACACFGIPSEWDPSDRLPAPVPAEIRCDDLATALPRCVRAAYDIMQDDASMRALPAMAADARGPAFDALRKNYRCRREFPSLTVHLSQGAVAAAPQLRALGFRCNFE